jgi:flagellar biosynthesis activator protein FlaF
MGHVNPASAYARTAQQTLSGRDLEAHVLLKSAARLQGIRDNWDMRQGELDEALTKNRRIWTVFVSSLSAEDCALPALVRSNLLNLGFFVFNHTIKLTIGAKPEQLGILIDINRNIAAGLRGDAGSAARPAAAA